MITLLHDPGNGPLRVAGLMSGSGSNIRKIIEHQKNLETHEEGSPYQVVVLFSDTWNSNASRIGHEFDIPVVIHDIAAFYAHRKRSRRDMSIRPEFDTATVKVLSSFDVAVAVYGGYMSIASQPLIDAFLGINVHPADLSVEEGTRRKFTGDHAVRDAIVAGERTVSASTHIITQDVDGGPILMISPPMPVTLKPEWDLSDPADLKEAEASNQELLKARGDWIIFPKTIEFIARGRYGRNEDGLLFFAGSPIPKGLRWKED
ncbi:MAG: formyl transferase [Deltaproteobacteria bacterium]|nr:formyl transferase [Deltaproteobacteria bacterium]